MNGIELLIFVMGFAIGALVYRWILLIIGNRILHEIIQESIEISQQQPQLACVVEHHNDQYFLYQHPDMKFIAQASTLDEINKIVQEKYKNPVTVKMLKDRNENSNSQ
jgi:hydroxymethylpyrimidine pyrophosphatase-like HAD family hydrolase